MRHLTATLRSSIVLSAILLASTASFVQAQQVWIPRSALLDEEAVRQVFVDGQALERSNKWAEALTHYEKAAKSHPGHTELQRRLELTRRRYSVARRYSDSSFVRSVQSLSTQKALNVYNEVLAKIQMHYVGRLAWKTLVRQGTDNLIVALQADEFRRRNRITASPEQIEAFTRRLQDRLASRGERSRLDAEISATIAADLARRELGALESAVILEYACGAANTLDDYSAYLTPDQYSDVMSQIQGNFVGLGIELKAEGDTLAIVNVIPGGPASKGGIRTGDRILEVDGQTVKKLTTDSAADMLRGAEGSFVNLAVLHGGASKPERVRLQRLRVEVPSIEDVRLVEPQLGVGYIKLTSFQKTTAEELDSALWRLHNQGMRYLILDLRGNPGGLLPASVKVADRFINDGVIVSTRGRNDRENFDYRAHSTGTWRVPLITLIDKDSASASEIFAGAVHDHRRGLILGERSYGKGSVQGIFPLAGCNAGIRLTTAKFYSPSGKAISNNGVSPDIAVHVAAKPVRNGNGPAVDGMLNHAVKVAREQMARR